MIKIRKFNMEMMLLRINSLFNFFLNCSNDDIFKLVSLAQIHIIHWIYLSFLFGLLYYWLVILCVFVISDLDIFEEYKLVFCSVPQFELSFFFAWLDSDYVLVMHFLLSFLLHCARMPMMPVLMATLITTFTLVKMVSRLR